MVAPIVTPGPHVPAATFVGSTPGEARGLHCGLDARAQRPILPARVVASVTTELGAFPLGFSRPLAARARRAESGISVDRA
jgi:hypothetical protein